MSHVAVDVIDVFLLAENRLFREALARVISKKSDLRVVGSSSFHDDALSSIVELNPHVLVWDPGSTSPQLQVARSLQDVLPEMKMILVGMDEDESLFLRCVQAGVAGYLLKDASSAEVALGIRTVAYDGAICSSKLCLCLFRYLSSQAGRSTYQSPSSTNLSRREQQLVSLVGQGLTNKEIANDLNISEQTVKNHIHRVLRKLGTTDRLSAVEICRNQGLVA